MPWVTIASDGIIHCEGCGYLSAASISIDDECKKHQHCGPLSSP